MSDHCHYASEVQGAAADNHIHTPRGIGAADVHVVLMLKRDLRAAETTITVLERQNSRQHGEIQALSGRVADLEGRFQQHMEHFITLARHVETIVGRLAESR